MRQKKVVLRACNVAIVTPIVRKMIKTWSDQWNDWVFFIQFQGEKWKMWKPVYIK